MTHKKVEDGYLLKFSIGDKFIAELTEFIDDNDIKAGWLTGLGAVKGAELGYYNLQAKEYEWHTVTKLMEITSLTGNVSWMHEKPVIHAHITLTGPDLKAVGGHVKELIIGGTCEVHLITFKKSIYRLHDDEVGLNLLDL